MDNSKLIQTILTNADYILDSTQAVSIEFGDLNKCDIVEEVEIDGFKFKIGISEVIE